MSQVHPRPDPALRGRVGGEEASFAMSRLTPLLPIVPFLALALWMGTRYRWFLGALMVGHALVHLMYFLPEPGSDENPLEWPFHLDRSWLLSGLSPQTVRAIGSVLAIAAVVGFVVTGAAVLVDAAWWGGAAIGAATASLALLIIFFQPLLLLGLLIDVFVLSMALWQWPTVSFLAGGGS